MYAVAITITTATYDDVNIDAKNAKVNPTTATTTNKVKVYILIFIIGSLR